MYLYCAEALLFQFKINPMIDNFARTRTVVRQLADMSPTSYHCSIPRCIFIVPKHVYFNLKINPLIDSSIKAKVILFPAFIVLT
jgi:hypothetical protein